MKKQILPCMLALVIAVILAGCGKETENKIVRVTVWVQLTNDSQENVYYWTGDNLTQTLVTVNSTATRQTQLSIESKVTHTYRFYLKKESSSLEYDKQSYYDIYVSGDKNDDVVEALFTWDGTTLTKH